MSLSKVITKAEYELDKFLKENPSVDKSFKGNILDLMDIFSEQGHSGMSAGACLAMFKQNNDTEIEEASKPDSFYGGMLGESVKELVDAFREQDYGRATDKALAREIFIRLANQENLTPITCEDSEWGEPIRWRGERESYQNIRLSSVFKEGKDGKPYYIDAVVFKEESGVCFTGSAMTKDGETIRSRQYIKLPFEPKRFYVDVIEGPNGNSLIKDEEQLEEVFEYYDKFE